MTRGAWVAGCGAILCLACSSAKGGPSADGGTSGRSSSPDGGDVDGGSGGRTGTGGRTANGGATNGGSSGTSGSGGSGGSGASTAGRGGAAGRGMDAGAADAGDGGAPDPEWPLRLPDKGVCTARGFCWAAPAPLGDGLESAWGSGPTDVWFVGHSAGGTIAHYDGAGVRGLTGLQTEWGNLVTGTAPNDVWVLGGPHALRYDGTNWTRSEPGTDKPLHAAFAVSKTLAFAAGDGGTVVKWDGTAWTAFPSGTTDDLTGVWAFDANDVWIAGTSAYHWNGTGWSSAGSCSSFWAADKSNFFCVRAGVALAKWDGAKWADVGSISVSPVRALWGTGPKDVVVLARDVTYRYDGNTFAVASSRGGVGYADGYPKTVGLWGSSTDSYWAAGPRVTGTKGSLYRYEGTAWAAFGKNLLPDGVGCTRQGVAFVGTGVAWTASNDATNGNKLSRWDGTTYTEYDPGTTKPLLALDARSPVDVWASAEGGDVTHFTGSSWTASNIGATVRLTALYAAASTSVWAGGEAGAIYEYDGSKWVDRSVQMSALAGLFGTAPNDVWAFGDKTYHYTTDWTAVDVPSAFPRLVAIWGALPDDLLAVALSADSPDGCTTKCEAACKGALLGWDGKAWSVVSQNAPVCGDTDRPVFAAFASSGNTGWATDGKSAYYFDGARFTKQPLPNDSGDLACGVGTDGHEVLVAGPYPMLRQKGP